MNYIKIAGAIFSTIMAVVFYREVRGKKPLRMGDNQFFIEDKSRISATDYYRSWRLIILCILMAIVCVCWVD